MFTRTCFMYACLHLCMYVCICVCVCMYACVGAGIYVCMDACMHIFTYGWVCTYPWMRAPTIVCAFLGESVLHESCIHDASCVPLMYVCCGCGIRQAYINGAWSQVWM